MKKYIFLALSTLAIIFGFNSCKPTDLTPAYIYITPEDFVDCIDVSNFNEAHNENFDQEKLAALTRHTFTHVNVYVNNKNLGCWELPCKVPVLDVDNSDSCTLIMIPAFQMSGMANTVAGYPFLNIYRQRVLLQKDHVYEVSKNRPKYIYSEYAKFPFFETFSNSSPFKPTNSPDQTNLTFQPVSYDGKNVGEIILNDANGQHFDVEATLDKPVFVGNYRTLLEVRYKTEGDVDVNMRMSTANNSHLDYPIGGFYASPNEWKTIHFDLTNTINTYHTVGGSTTLLTIVLSGGGEEGKETRFYIDDIKVVYIRTA
jgi:hypothetical protein